jgi:hypothetical protein
MTARTTGLGIEAGAEEEEGEGGEALERTKFF